MKIRVIRVIRVLSIMSGEQHIDIEGNVEKSIFTSGDHNLTVLGNIIVYPSSHEQAPEQPAAVPEIGPNPYKGLSAFHEQDHERFFGRDALIKELHAEFVALHTWRNLRVDRYVRAVRSRQ